MKKHEHKPEYQKAYRAAHRDKLLAQQREYYAAHREELNEKSRQYRLDHREELNAYGAEYRETHREELSAKTRQYYQDHSERLREYAKQRRRIRREEINAAERAKGRQTRIEVLEHYGNKCVCCGETTFEFLAIDHINNNGAEHRRSFGGSIYKWLRKINYPEGFQILCHNCNLAKGFYGICPHQKVKSDVPL